MWIKRIETDRWITIIAPESPQWQDFTTRLSGEWIDVGVMPDNDDEIQWGFRTYRAFWPEVSAALRRIFGEDGDPQPRADVLVRWPAAAMAQRTVFFELGRPLLIQRRGPHAGRVEVGAGVAIAAGEFAQNGIVIARDGRAEAALAPISESVTLRVAGVPALILERWTDYCSGALLERSDQAPTARDREAAERCILELARLLPDDHPVVRAIWG